MRTRPSALLPIVISTAVLVAFLALSPITTGTPIGRAACLVVAVPGVVGAVTAWLSWPRLISTVLGLLIGAGILVWEGLEANPRGDVLTALGELWISGVSTLQEAALPLALSPALMWLLAAGVLILWFVAATLADALDQPAWSIVPLALPFAIASVISPEEVPVVSFLMVAVSYVAVLLSAGANHTGGVFGASRWIMGLLAAAVAIGATLVTANAVPMGPKQPWLSDNQRTPIQLGDPTVELTENLTRPTPVDVLTYSSSDGQPHYLRTTALTRLTVDGAQLASMRLSPSGLDGAYDAPGTQVEVTVAMRFPSQFLPAPFAPDSWDADGQWGFDRDTLSIVATSSDGAAQTQELDYRVASTMPTTDPETIAAASAGNPGDDNTTAVPDGVSDDVRALVSEITADATTDGQKAQAIEAYLNSDRFEYTLQAPNATGSDAISAFLLQDRAGYCVHFATSMAIMARIERIPSRVAVGFTGGTPAGDGFLVTTDNMHAWPELYFEGLGWVPFEPTKSYGAAAAPQPSTDASQPAAPPPTPSDDGQQTQSATPDTSSSSPTPNATPSPTDGHGSAGGDAGWLGIALLVTVVLLVPAGLRYGLTLWRLRGGREPRDMAHDAWRELADTSVDLHYSWADDSPVEAVRAMQDQWDTNTAAHLLAVAETVQRTLYARQAPAIDTLAGQVKQLRRELRARVSPGRRVVGFLAPASLLSLLRFPRVRRRFRCFRMRQRTYNGTTGTVGPGKTFDGRP